MTHPSAHIACPSASGVHSVLMGTSPNSPLQIEMPLAGVRDTYYATLDKWYPDLNKIANHFIQYRCRHV